MATKKTKTRRRASDSVSLIGRRTSLASEDSLMTISTNPGYPQAASADIAFYENMGFYDDRRNSAVSIDMGAGLSYGAAEAASLTQSQETDNVGSSRDYNLSSTGNILRYRPKLDPDSTAGESQTRPRSRKHQKQDADDRKGRRDQQFLNRVLLLLGYAGFHRVLLDQGDDGARRLLAVFDSLSHKDKIWWKSRHLCPDSAMDSQDEHAMIRNVRYWK